MNRLLILLMAWICCTLAVGGPETTDFDRGGIMPAGQEIPDSNDRLYDLSGRHSPDGQALLSDHTVPGRICSSRPQRLLPSGGPFPGKPLGQKPDSRQPTTLISLPARAASAYDGKPLRPAAPCDYYVFTLRHIIR